MSIKSIQFVGQIFSRLVGLSDLLVFARDLLVKVVPVQFSLKSLVLLLGISELLVSRVYVQLRDLNTFEVIESGFATRFETTLREGIKNERKMKWSNEDGKHRMHATQKTLEMLNLNSQRYLERIREMLVWHAGRYVSSGV